MARLTVVGSLNMDLVVRSPRLPRPGETIIGGDFQTAPGGKGANQAVAAARLGAQVSMVGRVGKDGFGDDLLAQLDAAGIEHRHVLRDAEAATGVAFIVVDDQGQNSIVVASGANMRLTPENVDEAEDTIAGSDVLLLQLESPLPGVTRAAEIAAAHGVTVLLNPAPAQELPPDLLALVDYLVPNESETSILTGMAVDDPAKLMGAAALLRDSGVGTIILTLGARGALLATAGENVEVPPFTVAPVDTTAAGDAFVAGFAVALAEGEELYAAARWGNAAGALATTKMGAQPSLPGREAVETILEEQPEND